MPMHVMQSSLQMMLQIVIWWNPGDAATAKYPRYDNASDWDNGYRNHMRTIAYAGMNSNGNADNTAYYSKGDYLCFREITLGYDLPKSVCGKLGVSGVSLSAGIQQHRLYHSFFNSVKSRTVQWQ